MNDELPDNLTPLEEELLLSMRLAGELAPESAAEVEAAEASWDAIDEKDLPESLRNPIALAAKIVECDEASNIIDIAPNVMEQEVEQGLARAARFGSSIPESIELKMKQDRRRAREKFKKTTVN